MTKKKDNTNLEIIHPVCCGLDIHKKKISACLITVDSSGKAKQQVKNFGTFTKNIKQLKEWLLKNNCPIVAMESTGIFWRPVYNVLEKDMNLILVNARHIKNVPGRKTDISDSKWLASLLRHGLLKGSFIPPADIREFRDLTRLRKKYTETLGDFARRVHKLFETANIKIGSVVSDLFGATGKNLIHLLCDENAKITKNDVANCAKGSLVKKVDELFISIEGYFKEHHRFQLIGLMETITNLENQISVITSKLDEIMSPHQDILDRLDEIPGIDKVAAQRIVSEIGVTLDEFIVMEALACWGGLCPGNNESAGKRKGGKSPVRKHHFKSILIEIAWSAIKKKGSYYKAKYYKLKARRGAKRAIVAIAHRISKAIYRIIKYGERYKELGEDYLMKKMTNEAKVKKLKQQAKKLGFDLVAC